MPFQYVPGFAECHALDGFPLDYFSKEVLWYNCAVDSHQYLPVQQDT